jgi:hypothetical protein
MYMYFHSTYQGVAFKNPFSPSLQDVSILLWDAQKNQNIWMIYCLVHKPIVLIFTFNNIFL